MCGVVCCGVVWCVVLWCGVVVLWCCGAVAVPHVVPVSWSSSPRASDEQQSLDSVAAVAYAHAWPHMVATMAHRVTCLPVYAHHTAVSRADAS